MVWPYYGLLAIPLWYGKKLSIHNGHYGPLWYPYHYGKQRSIMAPLWIFFAENLKADLETRIWCNIFNEINKIIQCHNHHRCHMYRPE